MSESLTTFSGKTPEKKDNNLETFEVDNLESLLKIWKDFRKDLADIFEKFDKNDKLKESDKIRKLVNSFKGFINEKLNNYTDRFQWQEEGKFENIKDAENFLGLFENFLVGFIKIFTTEVLNDGVLNKKFTGEKLSNEYSDGELMRIKDFVEAVIKLNDGLRELNGDLSLNVFLSRLGSSLLHVNFSDGISSYDDMVNLESDEQNSHNYESEKIISSKECNTGLWLIVYRPLLDLVCKELEYLLESDSEEKFKERYKKSLISSSLNIKSYEDFLNKREILEHRKNELENFIKQNFDGDKLKPGINILNLPMENLWKGGYLDVSFRDRVCKNIKDLSDKTKGSLNESFRWTQKK